MELKCQCGSTDLESYALTPEELRVEGKLTEHLVCLKCNRTIEAVYRLIQITYSTTTTTSQTIGEKEHGA